MNLQEAAIKDELEFFAKTSCTSELISVLMQKDASSHYSIQIDSLSLFEHNIVFAHYFFQNPRKALKILDDAFKSVSIDLTRSHSLKAEMIFKENLHVRLVALPHLPEIHKSVLPKCSEVGLFMCITGTVIRSSVVKMLQYRKIWRCGKCKFQFNIDAEVDLGYIFEKPCHCPNPVDCNGKNFTLLSSDINTAFCKDYQEIKIQEQVYNLGIGTVPRSMWVILEDDLVETCFPGNDVCISGVLIQRWKPLIPGRPIDIDLVLLAHNVEVKNKMSCDIISKNTAVEFGKFWLDEKTEPLFKRNFILSSISPQVFGLYIVKLAVALTLAGGVQKEDGHSKVRGDSHLLLVGDPGTAKSQFLKFASKVSTRAVLTSGIGTTNAGLTVSAVKESGKWQLEAGALVLADGGTCCIDEFSCIKEHDKTCIHEAMEQQTISVAKAGLVCSLNTRCSIIAATNPKGKYDEALSLSENTALASPLLSRFDIVLVLLDTFDHNWDEMVSSFILNGRNVNSLIKEDDIWPITKMKNYFALIRYIKPKVTHQCERILEAYYKQQRSASHRNAARTTPRLLQSLLRLAEGHARLMFRDEVLIIDAVMAIILMESSMLGFSVFEELSPLHTTFPIDPDTEYEDRAKTILELLKLQYLIPEIRSFENSYTEFSIKRSLLEISSVWDSKEEANQCESFEIEKSESYQETFELDILQENVSALNSVTLNCDARQENRLVTSDSAQTAQNVSEAVNKFIDNLACSNSEFLQKAPYCVTAQGENTICNENRVNQFDEISTVSQLNKVFSENTSHFCQDIPRPFTVEHTENIREVRSGELFDRNKNNQIMNNKESVVKDFTQQRDSGVKMDTTDINHNLPPTMNSTCHESPVAKKQKLETPSSTNTNIFKKFIFMRKKTFEVGSDWLADIPNDKKEPCSEQELKRNEEIVKTSTSSKELCINEKLCNNVDTNAYSEHTFINLPLEGANSSSTENSSPKLVQKEVPSTSERNSYTSRERISEKMNKFIEKASNSKQAAANNTNKLSSNKTSDGNVIETEKAGTSLERQNDTKTKQTMAKTQSSQATFKRIFGSVCKFDLSDFDLDGPVL
ncbi:DNA helicase MCM9-like [Uloborus diversus]|uniref:DNA helicase MCM9-like n=1 Tax=Uloborus diversus TaxID=327109 RepID=UPI00240A8809|nr:DNA helicase MCM9-like [Uloborus diversus]